MNFTNLVRGEKFAVILWRDYFKIIYPMPKSKQKKYFSYQTQKFTPNLKSLKFVTNNKKTIRKNKQLLGGKHKTSTFIELKI